MYLVPIMQRYTVLLIYRVVSTQTFHNFHPYSNESQLHTVGLAELVFMLAEVDSLPSPCPHPMYPDICLVELRMSDSLTWKTDTS
jgi:hypothetical protein